MVYRYMMGWPDGPPVDWLKSHHINIGQNDKIETGGPGRPQWWPCKLNVSLYYTYT